MMATFEANRSSLIRGIRAFFRLKVGLSRGRVSANEEDADGDELTAGQMPGDFPAHRAYVGKPDEWDLVAARQVTLLLAAGLRDNHLLADVGCGSLRAGRMLIPYLHPEHYFGVDPNGWLVEEGIEHELGRDLVRIKRPTFRFVDDFSLSTAGDRHPQRVWRRSAGRSALAAVGSAARHPGPEERVAGSLEEVWRDQPARSMLVPDPAGASSVAP
jgi:hypothetical protein